MNTELQGVLDPSNSVLSASRIRDNGAFKIQADYFQDTINDTREWISELSAKDDKENKENISFRTSKRQEEDISRLQRFKEWIKENILGISAVSISIIIRA